MLLPRPTRLRSTSTPSCLLADLGVDGHRLAIKGSLGGLGVGDALRLTLLDVVTALLELLDVARSGRLGELVGEQVVLRKALSDVHDVALAALAPELTQKDDLHVTLLSYSAVS